MIRDARWLAAIGAAISPALLVSDLGVPTRFLNMLRVFKVQSAMSVGSWTLMSFSSAAAASAVLTELERRRVLPRIPVLTDVADIGAALTGLVLATYTGVLVGATAIPVWNAKVSLIPIHFATSGLSTAVSVLELRGHTSSALNKIGIGATVVETAIGASLELGKEPATEPLHHGPTGWTMRVAGCCELGSACRLATRSTWSPACSVPASNWFASPGTCTARSVPFSWARIPSACVVVKRRSVTWSPW